jgi:L-ascorbate metabolism protein UlaG (beta-lactamase superfamily)
MNIFWFGESSVKIEGEKATVVADMIEKSSGLSVPRPTADVVLISTPDVSEASWAIRGPENTAPLVIDKPGEYEIKDTFVYGVSAGADNMIFRIEIDGIAIAFFGKLDHAMSNGELEKLEGCDIVIIPIGGNGALNAQQATAMISQLEPRVVIPVCYQLPGLKTKRDTKDAFCKEIGICPKEELTKYKIAKKDLPQQDLQVVVLQP